MGKISVLSHQDTQDVDVALGRQLNVGGSADPASVAVRTTNFYDLQESHRAVGDTANRHEVFADGYMKWGPGNAGPDTWFYRDGAAKLRTNGVLAADGAVTARGGVECANLGDVPGGIRHAYLTADQQVVSSTVFVNTGLTFPVSAGVYEIQGLLHVVGDTTADMKFAWSAAANSIFRSQIVGPPAGATSTDAVLASSGFTSSNLVVVRGLISGQAQIMPVTAFAVFTVSGTLTLQFSQSVASANFVRLSAGSYLKCTRLG